MLYATCRSGTCVRTRYCIECEVTQTLSRALNSVPTDLTFSLLPWITQVIASHVLICVQCMLHVISVYSMKRCMMYVSVRIWDVRPYAPVERCVKIFQGNQHTFEKVCLLYNYNYCLVICSHQMLVCMYIIVGVSHRICCTLHGVRMAVKCQRVPETGSCTSGIQRPGILSTNCLAMLALSTLLTSTLTSQSVSVLQTLLLDSTNQKSFYNL